MRLNERQLTIFSAMLAQRKAVLSSIQMIAPLGGDETSEYATIIATEREISDWRYAEQLAAIDEGIAERNAKNYPDDVPHPAETEDDDPLTIVGACSFLATEAHDAKNNLPDLIGRLAYISDVALDTIAYVNKKQGGQETEGKPELEYTPEPDCHEAHLSFADKNLDDDVKIAIKKICEQHLAAKREEMPQPPKVFYGVSGLFDALTHLKDLREASSTGVQKTPSECTSDMPNSSGIDSCAFFCRCANGVQKTSVK